MLSTFFIYFFFAFYKFYPHSMPYIAVEKNIKTSKKIRFDLWRIFDTHTFQNSICQIVVNYL